MGKNDDHESDSPPRIFEQFLCLSLLGVVTGSLSACFLYGLDIVGDAYRAAPWLLWFLPVVGVGMVHVYQRYGASAQGGTDALLEEIHHWRNRIPRRMAPMILVATWLTHLFGGSAGREGTALQMGGAVAAGIVRQFPRWRGLAPMLLMAGLAAGFGAVFGTPWAGVVFAMELSFRGQWQWSRLLPCWIAAWIADVTCMAWGIEHTDFAQVASVFSSSDLFSWKMVWLIPCAGLAFGLCGRLYLALSMAASRGWRLVAKNPLWRPMMGGLLLIAMVYWIGNGDYLGLGVEPMRSGGVTLLSCFEPGGAEWGSWLAKMLFTVITLSSGFKGGEVTPLFFIGAAWGNSLAMMTGQPVPLWAAMGMIAVLASASKTPWACALLGWELFGLTHGLLGLLVCGLACRVGGRSRLYRNPTEE